MPHGYYCHFCKIRFFDKQILKLHNVALHQCSYCDCEVGDLENHMYINHVCIMCNMTCENEEKMIEHVEKYHPSNVYYTFE